MRKIVSNAWRSLRYFAPRHIVDHPGGPPPRAQGYSCIVDQCCRSTVPLVPAVGRHRLHDQGYRPRHHSRHRAPASLFSALKRGDSACDSIPSSRSLVSQFFQRRRQLAVARRAFQAGQHASNASSTPFSSTFVQASSPGAHAQSVGQTCLCDPSRASMFDSAMPTRCTGADDQQRIPTIPRCSFKVASYWTSLS